MGGTFLFFSAGKCPRRALEDSVQGVVVLGGDGFVFVVVAPRTTEGHAEEGSSERVDGVGKVEVLEIGRGFVAVALSDGEKTGCRDEVGILFGWSGFCEDVSRDLLPDEGIKGEISIECADDPVAVASGFTDGIVGAVPGGVGVSGDVQPVSSPAFAIRGGG